MATKVGDYSFPKHSAAVRDAGTRRGKWCLASSDKFPMHRPCSQCGFAVVEGEVVLVLPTYRYSRVSSWGLEDAVIHAECLERLMFGPSGPKQLLRSLAKSIVDKYLKKT